MSLFRPEVSEHRKGKLHGDVQMALPLAWQIVGGLVFAALIAAIFFLSMAEYTRIETVSGILAPSDGVAQITAARTGVINKISVTEGERVGVGAPLVEISTDERLTDGFRGNSRILETLLIQEAGLKLQEQQIRAVMHAEQSQLSARISGLREEISSIREQIVVQENLLKSAKQQLDQAQAIAERGFISRRDILIREETFLTRQQQLSGLRQTLARQMAGIEESIRALQQASANSDVQISALNEQKSDISQRKVSLAASSAYQIAAPIRGEVTAITARVGQSASSGRALLTIVPDSAKIVAELYVPSAAYGFIEIGQDVRLAIDAYPYQRFGTTRARIISIARSTIAQTGPNGNSTPVFLVTAVVDSSQKFTYSNKNRLTAGMTLSANIVTEKQSLIRWLFEPLFSVRNR